MKKSTLDYAQEEIRKALVQEYLRKHPGVREQDVVLACKDGQLVFTEISAVLADVELRKQSGQVLLQANRMFAELAVHHDERWKECVQSAQHCRQIIDCLHSSNFGYLSEMERFHHLNVVKRLEKVCASSTVSLHDATQKLAALKEPQKEANTLRTKSLVIDYLVLVIDQLKSLLSMLKQETKLSDFFLEQSQRYLSDPFVPGTRAAQSFSIQKTRETWLAVNEKKECKISTLDDAYALNEEILIETKNALLEAVEEIKTILIQRRKRIHDIWMSISSIEETVQSIDESKPLPKPERTPAMQPNKITKSPRTQTVVKKQEQNIRYRTKN